MVKRPRKGAAQLSLREWRSQVDVLLRGMDLMQVRLADGIETDFVRLRTELGL